MSSGVGMSSPGGMSSGVGMSSPGGYVQSGGHPLPCDLFHGVCNVTDLPSMVRQIKHYLPPTTIAGGNNCFKNFFQEEKLQKYSNARTYFMQIGIEKHGK